MSNNDDIMVMVDNIEPLYNDKIETWLRWIEQGDRWTKRAAKKEALALATHFAEALEHNADEKYSQREIREAAGKIFDGFEYYREEHIRWLSERQAKVIEKKPMDEEDIKHAKKYESLANEIGIERLKSLIPASPQKVRSALEKGDEHLNTVSLMKWDKAASFVEGPLSLSEKVCLLKHVAKWHYA